MHLNLFAFAAGHHTSAWRAPDSAAGRLGDITYWEELAQIAERGFLDAVFLADGQSADLGGVGSGPLWFLEPVTTLSALARATEHIGLVTTISSTFWSPFHAARQLASLDHISGGRAGINVVTSMNDTEARNHGMPALPPHAERYARAEEFITVLNRLWDSFPAEAVRNDPTTGWGDGSQLVPLEHSGEYFEVAGPLNIPAPPQGRPVLFQAGASEPGRNLAAKHAEGIYAVAWDLEMAREYRLDVRRRAELAGRDPDELIVMPGLVTYVGRTEEEAREKQRALNELLPVEDALKGLSYFIAQDTSGWELDAPVPQLPTLAEFTGPKGRYATILRIIESKQPTVRELLGYLAAGGGHATFVGTPEQIADEMARWVEGGGADGFNLMPPSLPAGIEDFVDLVIPVLQERGLFRTEYAATTLRGHLAE
ncbi:LLM class flavin-dependent oxidoreductase [Corynebacterium sp. YIM 101645]|uniref:LLM class flavin-dependent oxidoreductase n=1 Tax=Corynebacterium lemuris TaxID=1859292 RepID=A0ABT2FYJ7_9CORY|nr:LLM class flavin-dependent oxidoreductase [Corynebacterium lemuris]MCS5480308.1 LLM class flavin-dependent oxidoreductase [Corynebacterium lemuris]